MNYHGQFIICIKAIQFKGDWVIGKPGGPLHKHRHRQRAHSAQFASISLKSAV